MHIMSFLKGAAIGRSRDAHQFAGFDLPGSEEGVLDFGLPAMAGAEAVDGDPSALGKAVTPSEVRATRWLLYVQPSRGLSIWSEPPADSVEKLLVPAPGTGPQAARTRAAASPIRDARRLTTDRS